MLAPHRLFIGNLLALDTPPGTALTVASSAVPRLGWVVPLERQAQQQTAWQVRASAIGDPREHGELWDSGTVVSRSNTTSWGGEPLASFTEARWTVRTTDENGAVSAWSEPVPLRTGPLEASDWTARWITFPSTHAAGIRFDTPAAVVRATLHFAGIGVVRAVIDGVAVNPDALDPTDSSLKRAVSRSYDVTSLLDPVASDHSLELVAGIGHHVHVREHPRVLAELHLVRADGATTIVGTSGDWTHSPSQITADAPFYLEEHDARMGTGTPMPPTPVDEVPDDADPASPRTVTPDAGPAVRVVREVEGRLIGRPDADVQVYDLGENLAGRVRVRVDGGESGRRLVIAHGEKLDALGRVDTTNIRLPSDRERERQLLAWTTVGSMTATETISPWFAVHGFRYVEVRGLADEAIAVSAGVLHSAVEQTGWFASSEPLLDRLVDMARRTQLNNTHGLPEDCPTREQSGWTGDATASVEAALTHLDLAPVYDNWLVDVALDARDGGVRGIAPNLQSEQDQQPGDPVWGAALTEIPWQQWWATGDIEPARPLLPAMREWADWQLRTLEDGVVRKAEISYGADWLAIEQTPPVLLQTAAVIRSLRALADLEEAAGHPRHALRRRAEAAEIVRSAREILHDAADAVWANDSQASIALALVTGLATETESRRLGERLTSLVHARGDRVASGFAGTGAVVRALAAHDGGTALLAAIRQPEQPGIGSMLVDGPGTFWETWWIDDDNVGVASLDHIGLGAPFAAWAWQFVAGLRPTEPGFRRFTVDPRLTHLVDSVDVRRMTRHGLIEVAWERDDDEFRCNVTVPVGTVADVVVPGGETVTVGSGRHLIRRPIPVSADATPASTTSAARVHALGETWLSDGRSSRWIRGDSGVDVAVEEGVVVCTPVYHEPIPGPTLAVSIRDFAAGTARWVTLEQSGPLDLGRASFVFAHFDVDGPDLPGRRVRPLLRLTSADGSTVEDETRPLPIAWNRVGLDVASWPGRFDVVRIEVGVRWTDEPDSGRGPFVPLPDRAPSLELRIARVGWTSAQRTW